MTSTALNDIYSHLPENTTKMKQVPPVPLQVHLSNRIYLLGFFIKVCWKWMSCLVFIREQNLYFNVTEIYRL